MLGHFDHHVGTRLSNQPSLLMEEERHRLARELHDHLLQKLTASCLRLDLCRQLSLNSNSAALREELVQLRRWREQVLASMRQRHRRAAGELLTKAELRRGKILTPVIPLQDRTDTALVRS